MKKAFLSPLCSALVIPGLGQILNQQLKKGTLILLLVLILFIWCAMVLFSLFKPILSNGRITGAGVGTLIERFRQQDLSTLWIIVVTSIAVWLFSVLDAYLVGRRIDRDADQVTS